MPRLPIIFMLVLLSSTSPLLAAPSADLWERWTAHNPDVSRRIDHRQWGELLRQYLYVGEDKVHRFAYGKVSESDREKLDRYIGLLADTKISDYNRDVQLAYWINLYNALTIQVVLHHFPVESIRDISSGLFSAGPWEKKLLSVEGEALSLNDIEHRILRPIWRDPRIHYAVNCASIGCPNLRLRVFTGGTTESMLDRAAREFINHPRGASIEGGKLRVSSIYDWFIDDFGGDDAGVIRHLKQYAFEPFVRALKDITKIDNDHYDWRINS
ncbi:MAG: DUF547 domain-containing protein, partial [Gammaproteobacteria bacterium]|nr:DUF547 domain-containing protein [Gammaproteobacteria bacterium]